MYTVYQHWDPLQVCVVGRSYPPEFFSWITNSKTREIFETMAQETEEDYQQLIALLTDKFGVTVLRPQLPDDFDQLQVGNKWVPPPTAPRDYFLMIHDKFWIPKIPNASHAWSVFYRQNKLPQWPDYVRPSDFYQAHPDQANNIREKFAQFQLVDQQHLETKLQFYQPVLQHLRSHSTEIVYTDLDFVNGCFVSRIGHDLYFATQTFHDDQQDILQRVNGLFPHTRNHVVNAGGHGDAVYCPVTPGLIISLNDVPTYADTFPGWEVIYLPPSDYAHMREFQSSIRRNKGRWFIPNFESDANLVDMVNHYFDHWVGQVSETVFDVNILIVDPKNIVVSNYNKLVDQACQRHGINMHVSAFRHRYFWDAGIHCITNDLHRTGVPQHHLEPR